MPRERDEGSGKYRDVYSDHEFLHAIRSRGGLAGTSEVAGSVGCTSRHALNRLRELETDGKISSRDVGRSLVWLLSEGEMDGRGEDQPDPDDPTEGILDDLVLGGERRAAVRAVYAYLREHGEARASDFEGVYERHRLGYADRRSWWNGLVVPNLRSLPNVEAPPEHGRTWRYVREDQ